MNDELELARIQFQIADSKLRAIRKEQKSR